MRFDDEGTLIPEPDLTLVQTSGACPEQYDLMCGEARVGYLRLRHGTFTAQVHGPDGPTVYEADTIGDGIFDSSERDYHIQRAVWRIAEALR